MPASPPSEPLFPEPPQVFDLTLEEFCLRMSRTDSRVEMIGGFHADEARNGRVKDSEEAFTERYQAFAVRPVN